MEIMNNKVKQRYSNLVKEGYYLKQEVFKNTTIYAIAKDLHCNSFRATRRIYGEVPKDVADKLVSYFGFKVKCKTLYFGNAEPVQNGMIRTECKENNPINLLN
ncbi:MAG TPA: hypothetical protein PLB74_03175 [Candidatus Paceibacterota bacterium]|nr:hypothetical protein [Candidatus Paceibacterota bacterium]